MPSPPAFQAEILRSSARGYASLAAERVVAVAPDAPIEFWRASLEGWIVELAAALADGVPEAFVRQMEWTRSTLASRGVDDALVRDVLALLREVLVDELPEDARATAAATLDAAVESLGGEAPTVEPAVDVDAPHGRLAASYVVALLEGRPRDAHALVIDAVEAGELAVADAYSSVLAPAQRELGRMWQLDEASVAEEHFVTSATIQVMSRLMAAAEPRAPNGKVVVATSVGGDLHDVGVRMVADLFELDGWRVVFLGANMPAPDLARGVHDFAADLVVVSATLAIQRCGVAEAVAAIRAVVDERGTACPVIVGGAAFAGPERLWRNVGADATADSARDAVDVGRRLVGLDD